MNDLISREALLKKYCKEPAKGDCKNCDWFEDSWCRCEIFGVQIAGAPAVDAVEVKRGRWVVVDDDYGWDSEMDDEFYYVLECECSECHGRVKLDRPNYCPNCGARMDGAGNG